MKEVHVKALEQIKCSKKCYYQQQLSRELSNHTENTKKKNQYHRAISLMNIHGKSFSENKIKQMKCSRA